MKLVQEPGWGKARKLRPPARAEGREHSRPMVSTGDSGIVAGTGVMPGRALGSA
ncbi:hypothetical protein [Pseudofrankia sp. BMG5.37]|uniref:hypothetical protein n=1 Tax=Pseudofrankia sp. BMG5.37 TaxID=3050035 RepID=UPI002893AE97|nr:hypothetical protein [Pseudofrankia sp. BMG5.37]MDT3438893.1 hypothetical protein [Pseudofrankia sp. BMG5.37]